VLKEFESKYKVFDMMQMFKARYKRNLLLANGAMSFGLSQLHPLPPSLPYITFPWKYNKGLFLSHLVNHPLPRPFPLLLAISVPN
jgi:hypothetical protein